MITLTRVFFGNCCVPAQLDKQCYMSLALNNFKITNIVAQVFVNPYFGENLILITSYMILICFSA